MGPPCCTLPPPPPKTSKKKCVPLSVCGIVPVGLSKAGLRVVDILTQPWSSAHPPHPCLPGPHTHCWISGSLTTQLLALWVSGFEPSKWEDTKKVLQLLGLAPSSWSARFPLSKSWQELEVGGRAKPEGHLGTRIQPTGSSGAFGVNSWCQLF